MYNEKKLLDLLKQGPLEWRDLVRKMKVRRDENKQFSAWLRKLTDSGVIFLNYRKEYYVPHFDGEVKGEIRLNTKGFGFIDIESEVEGEEKTSYFIPANSVNTAMDGDEVRIKYFEDKNKPGMFQGVVVEILLRKRSTFVGRVVQNGKFIDIKPFDARLNGRFSFVNYEGFKVGDEIKVEIVEYGFRHKIKMIKNLGNKDDVSVDILIAIEDAGIKSEFSADTLDEANHIPDHVTEEEMLGREDLRDRLIVTIDGDDTKDFDDAIEVRKLDNGNYLLGVHIADVSHYVKEGNPLDDEAKLRGTSVYLADRVIPMLPEKLSNGICSLNPHVDRLTLSAEMEIDKDGNNVNYRIFPSVINSKHRLTYKEVNNFFRDKHSWEDDNLNAMITHALELSKVIRDYKNEEGYIDFEIEEAKLIIDEQGKTSDIVTRERLESEILIEDFMVRANETVAHHAFKNELAFVYRIHDKPDADKITGLNNVMKVLGIDAHVLFDPEPKQFANVVNKIKESRFDDFMKIMMLRTMAKAEYSADNIGHFGLASKEYTHFTSPIRRYPDLMVHRMTREYFFEGNKDKSKHFEEILPAIATASSLSEQTAVKLERKVADIKKAEFYEQYVGQSFEGTIVSMQKFGFFVEFPNKVDGLVHVSSLIDGDYEITDSGYAIQNKQNKDRLFTIGDTVSATVVGAIKNEGKIDLVLTDLYDKWKDMPKKPVRR